MKRVDDIKVVIFNPEEREKEIVRRFLSLPGKEHIEYRSEAELSEILGRVKAQGLSSKEVLVLKRFLGRFFQKCPGTPGMICCNYRLINTGFGCLYNCAYCYLQVYLNSYGMLQFTNMDEVCAELDAFIETMDKEKVYRIGTGEFTDSLMMDDVTGISRMLIEKLAKYPSIMLELKTKSDNIAHLLDVKDKGNTVVAWSVNTPRNVGDYEEGAATLDERLASAREVSDAGYFLAFHFDPVILYDGWESDYEKVVQKIFSSVDQSKVVWISLGGFRYTPDFKDVLLKNFPDERMTCGELFAGKDGKYRYLKKNRIEIYRFMKKCIEKYTDFPFIYMCMESDDLWSQVFGRDYSDSDDLENDMASYLKDRFLKNRF